ncbi:hypothetical protein CRM22_001499 [Opisthorchis felineus]|uniref:VWFA domain-containing protein n=1 Tax=Opisthorchis felineus TaxID=147828 RepID=A0A4S2MAC8_OPIFE|nr:hypothetical protein CRM22_001499 [Opisthorchis felineus]
MKVAAMMGTIPDQTPSNAEGTLSLKLPWTKNSVNYDALSQDISSCDSAISELTNSETWLSLHGLRVNRLNKDQLLKELGFLTKNAFVPILRKYVKSSYSDGLFRQIHGTKPDEVFNVTVTRSFLEKKARSLLPYLELYKKRLDWLNSGSRTMFGVLQEQSVTILIDVNIGNVRNSEDMIKAIACFLKDQVKRILEFNLVHCVDEPCWLHPSSQRVSSESIRQACHWLYGLKLHPRRSIFAIAECLRDIRLSDQDHDAVYLITDGESVSAYYELLRKELSRMRCPLHIVAYGCTDLDSLKLLSSLSKASGGRFHAYAPQGCLLDYSASPVDSANPEARLTASEVVYGGTPEGWPQREDCMRIFEELEEARSTLNQIQRVIEAMDRGLSVHIEVPCTEDDYTRSLHSNPSTNRQEEQMSSKQWLQKHGLGAQRLDLFDVLAQASFRHCDGMVDILRPPTEEESGRSEKDQMKAFRHNELLAERLTAPLVPSAIIHPKHIDARYCDQFAHIVWKDGQVVHVQVTPEHYRLYARRVQANLTAIQKRIDWLCRGSRELFGTITEDNVCIVIDTSTSMSPSINFVKQKFLLLLEEQLKYRKKMNFIAYSDKVMAWSEYCLETTAENIISAANWAKNLTCGGSTNTLAALQFALSDTQIESIYLLTDGRPDQTPRTILLKMHLQSRIPIHAISFNCQDPEANQFLLDLAKESGGRFQYFTLTKKAPEIADQWESEDIRLLRAEYRLGLRSLERMAELRDECRRLARESALIQRKRKRTSEVSRLKKSDESELLPRVGQRVWKSAQSSTPRKTAPKPGTMKFNSPGTNVADEYQCKRKTDGEITGSSRQIERGQIEPEQIKPAQLGKLPRQENKAGTDDTSTRKLQPDYEGKEHVTLFRTKDILEKLDLKEASHSKENLRGKQSGRQFKEPESNEKDKPIDISSWIARYGLRPLKLRLIDLLSPVAVPLRPSYIPSLRHNIISNVLLETLPVAFISPSKRSESEMVHVFNPLAVDYDSYEKALTAALARIERKLFEVVARYLSEDGVKRLVERSAVKQDLPWQTQICWYQYKDAIIQAFEDEQWPIAKKDFYIIANELDKGGQDYLEAKKLKRFGRTSTQQSPSIFRQPCGHKIPRTLQ